MFSGSVMGRRTKNAHPSPIRSSNNQQVPKLSPQTSCQPSPITVPTAPSLSTSPTSCHKQAATTPIIETSGDNIYEKRDSPAVNIGPNGVPKLVEAYPCVNGQQIGNEQETYVVISQYEPVNKQLRMLPPSNFSTFTIAAASSCRPKPAVLADKGKKKILKIPAQNQIICRPKFQLKQPENNEPPSVPGFNDGGASICKFLPSLANQSFPAGVPTATTPKCIIGQTERLSTVPGGQKALGEFQNRGQFTFLSADKARAKLDEAIYDGVRAKLDTIAGCSLPSRPTKRRLDSLASASDIAVSLGGNASVTKKGRPSVKLSQQIQLENNNSASSKISALPNGNINFKQKVHPISQVHPTLPPSIENSSMLIRPIKDVRSSTPRYPGNVCEVKLCKVVNSRATDIRALPVNKVLNTSIQLSQKNDGSLSQTAKRFVEYLQKSPESSVDLNITAFKIQCPKRRLYDITNVLEGVGLLEKVSKNVVQWTAKEIELNQVQISSLKDVNAQLEEDEKQLDNAINELHNLYDQEIENCINARFGYVTHDAVTKLDFGQNRLLIFANGPRNTELSLYSPNKLALRSNTGYIEVCMTNTVDQNRVETPQGKEELPDEVDCLPVKETTQKSMESDAARDDRELLAQYRRQLFNHDLLRKVEDIAASLASEGSSAYGTKRNVTSIGSACSSSSGGGFVSSRISPIDDVSRDSGLDSPTRCCFGGVSTPVLPFTPQQCTHKCTDTCICSTHTDISNDSAISNYFTPLNTTLCTTTTNDRIPPLEMCNTPQSCRPPVMNALNEKSLDEPSLVALKTPIPKPASKSMENHCGREVSTFSSVSTYYDSSPSSEMKKIESSFKPIPVTEFADYVFTIDNRNEGILNLFP